MLTHKHHIVPRHAGGTDHPWNLIEVPVHEHANLHWLRFIETGDWQDRVAYMGLLGYASSAESYAEASRQASLDWWKTSEGSARKQTMREKVIALNKTPERRELNSRRAKTRNKTDSQKQAVATSNRSSVKRQSSANRLSVKYKCPVSGRIGNILYHSRRNKENYHLIQRLE